MAAPTSWRACNGIVKHGASAVANLRGYSVNVTTADIDSSEMGSCTSRTEPGRRSTTGQVRVLLNVVDDAAQAAMLAAITSGATAAMTLQPFGATVGLPEATTAAARIGGYALDADVDGLLDITFDYSLDNDDFDWANIV